MKMIFRKKLTFTIFLFCAINSYADSGFFKRYLSSSTACGYALATSSTEQIAVIGSRFAPSAIPFFASLDATGTIKYFGTYSTSSGKDNVYSIVAGSDDTFFVAGSMSADNNGRDLLVYKVRSTGELIWARQIGSPAAEVFTGMAQTPSGLILVGISIFSGNADILVIKMNPQTGMILWKKTYGDSGAEFGYSVAATNEGGVVVAGVREDQPLLLKIDRTGKLVWSRLLETILVGEEGLPSMAASTDFYYIAGTTGGGHHLQTQAANDTGIVISKVSSDGTLIWSKHYHNSSTELVVSNLAITSGEEVIVSGQMGVAVPRALVFKIDSAGKIRWKRILKESNSAAFFSASMQNEFVITTGCVGTAILDLFTLKIDERNGNLNKPCNKLQAASIASYPLSGRVIPYSPSVRNFPAVFSSPTISRKNVSLVSADTCTTP